MIHSKMQTSTGTAGSTVGTFDPITTRFASGLTLPDGASAVYGFFNAMSQTAITAAKSFQARLRVTAPNLLMNQEDFLLGALRGSGIATNDDGFVSKAEYIPFNLEKPGIGVSTLNFSLAQSGVTSGNTTAVVCGPQAYVNDGGGHGPPAPDWFQARQTRPAGGVVAGHGAVGGNGTSFGTTANSNTSLSTSTMRGEFHIITAILLSQVPAAVGTAGDAYVAWADFASGGTTALLLSPQELPLNAIAPALGVPVGAPVYDDIAPLPVWITKPSGNDVTIDCLANEIIAITGAASGAYGLTFRRG